MLNHERVLKGYNMTRYTPYSNIESLVLGYKKIDWKAHIAF